jgi:hypothetical protein
MATRTLDRVTPISTSSASIRCRRKFLRFFPNGFADETYLAWERNYKQNAHHQWERALHRNELRRLLREGNYVEAAARAVRIESRTNLLFSFEKMALRDAVKTAAGAKIFATGLDALLHGPGSMQRRFEHWCNAVSELPRQQTRVMTWPLVTVFGFLAQPQAHMFLKPNVTRAAANAYKYDHFIYQSRPNWQTYQSLLGFAGIISRELIDLSPRDFIDIQSFMWVQGSEEYD